MNTPDIFIEFCAFFHQDIMLAYSTPEAAIREFFANHSSTDISQLQSYIEERLRTTNLAALEDEWHQSGADGSFPNEQIGKFYEAVLKVKDG